MGKRWKREIGVAMLALCVPALTMAAPTKEELMQKSRQHKTITGIKPKSAGSSRDRQALHEQTKALHAQKKALLKERGTFARQHNMAKLNKNKKQIAAVNADMKKAGKGGNKK